VFLACGLHYNLTVAEILPRREVNKMTKGVFLLCNLLLSSTLFLAAPAVEAEEVISRVPRDRTVYCHPKFPTMRVDAMSMDHAILDPLAGNVADFYGPCDYDPAGLDEIRVQRSTILRSNFDDGD
jgi:hypothetical protein